VSETTLLLPGWGTHPERLGPLAERVRAAGRSTRLVSYTPDGTIDALARRVRDLAPDGPLHLVGHSLGGLVVAAAALRHLTGRVRTVTTVNGAPALDALRDELAAHLADEDGPRWLVLGMAGDLATPATTSLTVPRGPRLERRLLPLAGHSQSLLAPRLHDVVAAHVDRAGVAQRPPADRTAASG
jgi:pimeloyl-ACP methyl ester carboxylesterase